MASHPKKPPRPPAREPAHKKPPVKEPPKQGPLPPPPLGDPPFGPEGDPMRQIKDPRIAAK
ncbi:hypothetical protein LVJ94_20480 [Pendulispora rubella]|uniref:Uncharacterized protein n=1 Tax=Pendulispora rubella TaxID=2741070 RepID=A0ABZ2LF78_9BACT